MCCCFSPASTTLKKRNPVFITLVHQHLKKNSNNKIKIIWLCLFWQNFFSLPACSHRKRKLYRKTSHSYDAESNALWCPAFFSPLCEIFCAQLLNNTWKHTKWKKKIAARFHLIWPSKNQTKQKLASVVIIIYYKGNDICKKNHVTF